MTFDFYRQAAGQHVKELSGVLMEMMNLARVGGHALFDNGQLIFGRKNPTVAMRTPVVVQGRTAIDFHSANPLSNPSNPGKLVATGLMSSTVSASRHINPATAAAMQMR